MTAPAPTNDKIAINATYTGHVTTSLYVHGKMMAISIAGNTNSIPADTVYAPNKINVLIAD